MAATSSLPYLPASPSTRPIYRPSRSIENLRALAQTHLSEIAASISAEHEDHIARNLQLQLYAKPAHLPRPPQHQLRHQEIKSTSRSSRQAPEKDNEPEADTPPPPQDKLPPLRPASDVLSRLRHDPVLSAHLDEYVIGYLERFDGMCEIRVVDWVKESTDEEFIPQHRIRYVIRRRQGDDELVWGRDARVDKIWGV
jgi:uncharacterized protein (UPF0248 family)